MNLIKRILCGICLVFGAFAPSTVFASGALGVDALDISGLVPIVLDAFMFVANGTYEYFVGHGDGIIYFLVWTFFAFYIAVYLIKLYMPNLWIKIFGFKPGDSIENTTGIKIAENVLKPGIRVLVAVAILLPLRPEFMAKTLINPFLSFGSLYTQEILKLSPVTTCNNNAAPVQCPDSLTAQGWLDKESCEYLIQPVHTLSQANNCVVKRGFVYLSSGLSVMQTLMSHNSGQGVMNIITGILLITTFVGCNIFMALLIIQAIFNFGMALILYPFGVAAWVAKKSDAWFDIWPPFSGILDALKQIVVTMIACAFMLCVNLALVRALFQWNSSMFVAAAGGTAYSNLPNIGANSGGFGGHSMVWLSCILTFFLMNKIFETTKEKLTGYVGKDATALYNQVKNDSKTAWGMAKNTPGKIKPLGKKAVELFDIAKDATTNIIGKVQSGIKFVKGRI